MLKLPFIRDLAGLEKLQYSPHHHHHPLQSTKGPLLSNEIFSKWPAWAPPLQSFTGKTLIWWMCFCAAKLVQSQTFGLFSSLISGFVPESSTWKLKGSLYMRSSDNFPQNKAVTQYVKWHSHWSSCSGPYTYNNNSNRGHQRQTKLINICFRGSVLFGQILGPDFCFEKGALDEVMSGPV